MCTCNAKTTEIMIKRSTNSSEIHVPFLDFMKTIFKHKGQNKNEEMKNETLRKQDLCIEY